MTIYLGAGSSLGGAPAPAYVGPGASALNVKTYGAKIDGKIVTDGAMSSSVNPTHLSSTAAAFTSADVGKAVLVWGAGAAGADLITTISSVAAGVATLAAAASTTVASTLIAYGTDDTVAWQAMLDALVTAQGGIGYQPPGISIVAGALRTSPTLDPFGTGWAYNAQLTLGAQPQGQPKYSIVLTGDRPMNWYDGDANQGALTGGSFLLSLSLGTPFATHSTVPSLIGGPDISAGTFTNVALTVKNLALVTPRNPQLCALNGARINHLAPRGLYVSTLDHWSDFASQPTQPVGIGIFMPTIDNYGNNKAERLLIEGYYCGMQAGEHTNGDDILIDRNYIGVSPQPLQPHAVRFGYLDIERSPYAIAYNDYTGSGLADIPANGGLARVWSIGLLDLEADSPWGSFQQGLNDPTNQLHGAGARAVVGTWSQSGGSNFTWTVLS